MHGTRRHAVGLGECDPDALVRDYRAYLPPDADLDPWQPDTDTDTNSNSIPDAVPNSQPDPLSTGRLGRPEEGEQSL
jgi:hypothetical protein